MQGRTARARTHCCTPLLARHRRAPLPWPQQQATTSQSAQQVANSRTRNARRPGASSLGAATDLNYKKLKDDALPDAASDQ